MKVSLVRPLPWSGNLEISDDLSETGVQAEVFRMKRISATFEDGVFKPDSPIDLPRGIRAEIVLQDEADDPVAVMRRRYPDSFGVVSNEAAEELDRIIRAEFGHVNHEDQRDDPCL